MSERDPSAPRLSPAQKRAAAETCVHFNLKRSVRAVTQRFNAALAEEGLQITQFTLLVTSSLLGAAPVTELAERLALDRTTLSRNLRPLEREGWIEAAPSEADARVRLVRITPAGEALLARAYPLWASVQEEVTRAFDDAEYAELLMRFRALEAPP